MITKVSLPSRTLWIMASCLPLKPSKPKCSCSAVVRGDKDSELLAFFLAGARLTASMFTYESGDAGYMTENPPLVSPRFFNGVRIYTNKISKLSQKCEAFFNASLKRLDS